MNKDLYAILEAIGFVLLILFLMLVVMIQTKNKVNDEVIKNCDNGSYVANNVFIACHLPRDVNGNLLKPVDD